MSAVLDFGNAHLHAVDDIQKSGWAQERTEIHGPIEAVATGTNECIEDRRLYHIRGAGVAHSGPHHPLEGREWPTGISLQRRKGMISSFFFLPQIGSE